MGMLPLNRKYSLLKAYYTGGIEEGTSVCSNCGRVITNIAEIKDEDNNVFDVGMDCMETIVGLIKNPHIFHYEQANFTEAKRIHNRMKAHVKKHKGIELKFTLVASGRVAIKGEYAFEFVPIDFMKSYLPQYVPMISNQRLVNFDFEKYGLVEKQILDYVKAELKKYSVNPQLLDETNEFAFGFGLPIKDNPMLHFSASICKKDKEIHLEIRGRIDLLGAEFVRHEKLSSLLQIERTVENALYEFCTTTLYSWFLIQ
jgi:hypothetical protein